MQGLLPVILEHVQSETVRSLVSNIILFDYLLSVCTCHYGLCVPVGRSVHIRPGGLCIGTWCSFYNVYLVASMYLVWCSVYILPNNACSVG